MGRCKSRIYYISEIGENGRIHISSWIFYIVTVSFNLHALSTVYVLYLPVGTSQDGVFVATSICSHLKRIVILKKRPLIVMS